MSDKDSRAENFAKAYEEAPVETKPATTNKWAMRDRLRSKVLWAAIVGCIMAVFSVFGVWEKIGITAEGFREIAASIGMLLAAFGVFNDPTNKEGF